MPAVITKRYFSSRAFVASRAFARNGPLVPGGPEICQKILRLLFSPLHLSRSSSPSLTALVLGVRNPMYFALADALPAFQRFFSLMVKGGGRSGIRISSQSSQNALTTVMLPP